MIDNSKIIIVDDSEFKSESEAMTEYYYNRLKGYMKDYYTHKYNMSDNPNIYAQLMGYNPIINNVDVTEVSQETFFNVDYSEIENRMISHAYPDMIINNQMIDLKMSHPEYIPMFDMPYSIDMGYMNDFLFTEPQTYPIPPQKWVRSRSKYHEPRKIFLGKAKRKRNLTKANRKKARHG
jgi:hypothetical protein